MSNARYFNKTYKNEAIPGVHFDPANIPAHIVELPSDSPFFTMAEPDQQPVYDADGMVSGVETKPELVSVSLDSLKAAKSESLNANYVEAMELILEPYPQAERDTFPEQAHEAIEYQKVVDAAGSPVDDDYPMLKNIATGKGIATSAQKDTVLAKRAAMNVFCGAVTGKRHSMADAIENAADETALDAIDVTEIYTFAQGLLA